NRGLILKDLLRFEQALESFDRALALNPRGEGWKNRVVALKVLGRLEEALINTDQAIAEDPGNGHAHCGRAAILFQLKRIAEAAESYDRAVALTPGWADFRVDRATCKMLAGDLAGAWADYESRWEATHFVSRRADLPFPQWKGDDLSGRSIVVYHEQ